MNYFKPNEEPKLAEVEVNDEGKNNHPNFKVKRVFFILPAYNEEESLPNLLERIRNLSIHIKNQIIVFVVNDGSSDGTPSILKKGVTGLNLKYYSHEVNLGLGQAVQTGIRRILKEVNYDDVIVIMDADDTHDVELLGTMITKIENGADIVIASRFVDGGDDSSAPFFRRLLSRGASFVFKTMLPLNSIKDFTSGYRVYRADLLKKAINHWGERLIVHTGFSCMVELLLKLRYWKPKIIEVPFVLRYDRKLGASKLKLFKTIVQYVKLAISDRLAPPPIKLNGYDE